MLQEAWDVQATLCNNRLDSQKFNHQQRKTITQWICRNIINNMAVGVESTVMAYTLNINRALKKKLKATQRNRTLQYKYTGGGIVKTADAASFELFKMAAIAYYEKPSPDGTPAIYKLM